MVGRNDPCPCGSGKKYKKCCLGKNNVVRLSEAREERFYRRKNELVDMVGEFIFDLFSTREMKLMESEFKKRTNGALGEHFTGFFTFWLYFFNRYDNGLRGIEWFLEENATYLTSEQRELTKSWVELKPRMLQAVDQNEESYLFKDYFSGEIFPMSKREENIPMFLPWYSTFALIEPLDNLYYFNGVRNIVTPQGFLKACELIQEIGYESNLPVEEIMFEHYPEILVKSMEPIYTKGQGEKEITEFTYTFSIPNKDRAEKFLYNEEDFQIEQWDEKLKKLSWLDHFRLYTDSELDGEVRIAEVLATIEMKNNKLTFTSYDLQIVNNFLKKVEEKAEGSLLLVDDQEERMMVPVEVEVKQMTASIDKNVPEYFILYAQSDWVEELDRPIPMFGNVTLRELVDQEQADLADVWFKESEFNLYKLVLEQHGQVEITADFNTARRELGLELSPFVTGGDQRKSSFQKVTPEKRAFVVAEADIPLYENLGFTPETLADFYTKDLVEFYKQKTRGKAEGTERKYRNGVYDIREALEWYDFESWEECDVDFWEEFLSNDFFVMNVDVSKTKVKDLLTVVKALVKWLASKGEMSRAVAKKVDELAKNLEPRMLNVVQLLNVENPYYTRGYYPEMSMLGSLISQMGNDFEKVMEGDFKIISVNKQSVSTEDLETGKTLTISLNRESIPFAEEGMVLSAEIGKSKAINTWNIIYLEKVSL
ncbi:SEC-C metal-binding domain-containing protein [Bacillaceae bacterium S4-13-56]